MNSKALIAMLRMFFEETIQRPDLPDSFRQRLNTQGRNVLRMDRLVRTLLELSVLELRTSLTLVPFDIAELTRSVMVGFRDAHGAGQNPVGNGDASTTRTIRVTRTRSAGR